MNLKKSNLDYYFLMYFKQILAIIIVVLSLAGCVSTLYIPTEIDAAKYNIPLDTFKTGRELYLKNCGSCHNLYLPSKIHKTRLATNNE